MTFRRAMLAGVLGLGVVAGLARAGEPAAPWSAPAVVQESKVSFGPGDGVSPQRHRLFGRLHNHPKCCWSDINSVFCGSFKADCTFIFGSCRTFFGEPCLKSPPPSLLPPGYGHGWERYR